MIAESTTFISSLGSTGLMALMVVVLAIVIKKFYDKAEQERLEYFNNFKETLNTLDKKIEESNELNKTHIKVLETKSEFLKESQETKLEKINSEFDNLRVEISKNSENISHLKETLEYLKKIGINNYKILNSNLSKKD